MPAQRPANPREQPLPGRNAPLARAVILALLAAVALCYAAPLVWMISTSIKPEEQAISRDLRLLPDPPGSTPAHAASNYSAVWTDPSIDFPLYLRNSLLVALLGVTGMTLSTAVVAYGFARIRWRGRSFLFAIVLATMMIPFPVIMAPLYVIFAQLGWIGSLKPLWLPAWFGGAFHGAFNIFLLRQFYMGIPKELDEAARIDGCSHWGIFWRIILPLSRPALAVVALLYFTYLWNDFLGPLIFLNHRDQFTLALGLQLYQSKAGNTPWNLLMAASTMVVAPVLAIFFLTQRTFISGVAAEGLKE
ncbi:MAG: carbohydrate ABC transporter permease [Planctomycetota bacterium]|nr:carbohydrate ABC transporter permease [Planctomycetota bacterium]